MHPVNKPISTPYRKQGRLWSLGYHTGVDYAAEEWTDIVAPASGYIARAGWDNSFGRFVILRSTLGGKPINIYLCHMTKILVTVGQRVRIGQHIGEVGDTGNATGDHCHLETREYPYGFTFNDIIDPKIAYLHSENMDVSAPTVLDIIEWNIARERWYTEWNTRKAEIQRELRGPDGTGEASLYGFQELFEAEAINTIKEALPNCINHSGPAGLEQFYQVDRWERKFAENRYSGIANRHGQKLTIKHRRSSQLVDWYNLHAPISAEGATAKARYGAWAANWIKSSTNPVIVTWDPNIQSYDNSPKKELAALGFVGFKQQAAITNEASKEFIPDGKDFCDIATQPAGPADIVGGEVDITTTSLESDHRKIKARIVIAPAA